LRELRLFFLGEVVSFDLFLMASIAEMGAPPAEEDCQMAAELALVLKKVLAVFQDGTNVVSDGTAGGTNEILEIVHASIYALEIAYLEKKYLCLELVTLPLVHSPFAVLESAVIGFFALEAHIVGEYGQAILLGVVVELRVLFEQLVVLRPFLSLKSYFELQPLDGHFADAFVEAVKGRELVLQMRGLEAEPGAAAGTQAEAEGDPGLEPLDVDIFLDAVVVEEVSALALDDGRLAQALALADVAVIALLLKLAKHLRAGEALGALLLTFEAEALVTASEQLLAGPALFGPAVLACAHGQLAVAALLALVELAELLAGVALVVGHLAAAAALLCPAARADEPVLREVHAGLLA